MKFVSGPGPLGTDIDFSELVLTLQKRFPENVGAGFASVAQGNTTVIVTKSVVPSIGDWFIIEVAYEKLASGDGDATVIIDGTSHTIQRGSVRLMITPDMLDVQKLAFWEWGITAAGAPVDNVVKSGDKGANWWTDGFDIAIQLAVNAGVGTMDATWKITHWKAR